jgi:hypothetical protein
MYEKDSVVLYKGLSIKAIGKNPYFCRFFGKKDKPPGPII